MLKRVENKTLKDEKDACVLAKDAKFPSPFDSKLEFSCSARGTWNIAHTGMLIPESHEVFVCAQSCLRGVVLTAAEMNSIDRFSNIIVRENNILEGDTEDLIVEGMGEILSKLPYTPKAVLVYTSCIHHFIGCDLNLVYKRLREKYPDVEFTDCYMNPIMRKSGLTPDQLMRRQLYSLLDKCDLDNKSINIIGNNLETDDDSELVKIIKENGFTLREVPRTKTYKEYKDMGKSFLNITYNPAAIEAGRYLEEKLNQKHLYLPLSYGFDEIEKNLDELCQNLKIDKIDFTENKNKECTFFSIPTFLNDCSFSQTVENSQEQNIQVMDEETRLFCKNFGPIKFDDSYFDLGNTYVSNFTARERQIKKIMRNFEIQPPVITNSIDISFLDQDNTYEMIDDKYFCK